MDITWLGHACFRLRSPSPEGRGDDLVVVTDPFPPSLGLKPDPRPATVVTVSNTHHNHSHWQEVAGSPQVFTSPGEYEHSGVYVRGVMTALPPETPREQRNVAYAINIGNVNICHLGDIAVPLTPRQIDELSPVDVLLVPTGGGCTLDVDRVFQMTHDLNPKIVIPMHYGTPDISPDIVGTLQGVDVFLRRMGVSDAQPQPRLVVTQASLPADLRVVVLAPQARPA